MDQQQVTLLAALIAALTSMISLLGDIFSTWSGELRATHRTALLPYIAEMGSSIDRLIHACIQFQEQVEKGNINPSELESAFDAVARLNELHTKVRYPLWGIETGVATLAQLPAWLRDWGNDSRTQKRLIQDAIRLKKLLDEIIRRSYRIGHPPSRWQVWQVRSQSERLKTTWGNTKITKVNLKNA